jgi:type III restriction enzyme
VNHFTSYQTDDFEVRKVLQVHPKPIAAFIHKQMMDHFREEATDYAVEVSKGLAELRASAKDTVLDERHPPADKSKNTQHLFNGFERCLYRPTNFPTDTAHNATRWFRPAWVSSRSSISRARSTGIPAGFRGQDRRCDSDDRGREGVEVAFG